MTPRPAPPPTPAHTPVQTRTRTRAHNFGRRALAHSVGAILGVCLTGPVCAQADEAPLATLLESLGEDIALYDMHLDTLANPFFEGRATAQPGNERAAEYLAFHFEHIGLSPAFPTSRTVDGVEVLTPRDSYFQEFAPADVQGAQGFEPRVRVLGAEGSMRLGEGDWATLIPDLDFAVLGCSGSGEIEGPVTFVGYSIPSGSDGYLGFPPGANLEGKIALAFRYEPMDESGNSLWAEEGRPWSIYAELEPKVSAAARRGAIGVVIVTPPGLPGEEANEFPTLEETSGIEFEIPVIIMSQERADFLLGRSDPEGRSLLELRRLVDGAPALIDMPGASLRISTRIDRTPETTRNVGGLLEGRGTLARELVVVGAHFDHVGYALAGGGEAGKLHPGADDNASGTSAMLLAAARLHDAYAQLPDDASARSILFLGFSAEERGLLGSKYYVTDPVVPIESHVFMLNMDMVGRVSENVLHVGGQQTAEGLDAWLEPFLSEGGFDYRPLPRGVFGRSDHASFFLARVPCVFFFSGFHDDYHKPTDVAPLINRAGAVRVSAMAQAIAIAMATRPDRPVFVDDDGTGRRTDRPPEVQPPAQRVRFGVHPGYDSGGKGVPIQAVSEGTAAAELGLQVGDIMTEWNGNAITGVQDWAPLLNQAKPGDEVTVKFLRGGQELSATVTLQASD